MKFKSFLALASCVATAACAPTQQEFASVDFGPFPGQYETIIKNHFASTLKDPYSPEYTFASPIRGGGGIFSKKYGWIVCGTVNAKNGFGGYSGAQPFYVIIHEAKIIDSTGPGSDAFTVGGVNAVCNR